MKHSKKIFMPLLALVAITIVVIAMRGSIMHGPEKAQASPIKIGLVYSLTGPAAVWAENGLHAAQLAVEEINADGGINGTPIDLAIQDGATNPASDVSSFDKLAADPSVKAIAGDMWSVLTNPLVPISATQKLLTISPTVMDVSVEGSSPYFFTLGHAVDSQEDSIRLFFDTNPDIHTLYSLCWNDAWGMAHEQLIERIAAEKHITVVGHSCTNDFSDTYRAHAAKVKASGADSVFITSSYEDVAIKALRDIGVKAKILTTTGIIEAVEARQFPISYTRDVWFMDWKPNTAFVQAFLKRFGTYPIMEAQNSYETIRSIAYALRNNPDDVLAGLKSVSYTSTDGKIDFSSADHTRINKAQAALYQFNADKSFREIVK